MVRINEKILSWAIIVALVLSGAIIVGVNLTSSPQDARIGYATKTSEGEVSIAISPLSYVKGTFTIELAINTHSVDLSQTNLQQQTILKFNGKEYTPLRNPTLSGHHTTTQLEFALPEQPAQFTIDITNIPDIKERIFSWP